MVSNIHTKLQGPRANPPNGSHRSDTLWPAPRWIKQRFIPLTMAPILPSTHCRLTTSLEWGGTPNRSKEWEAMISFSGTLKNLTKLQQSSWESCSQSSLSKQQASLWKRPQTHRRELRKAPQSLWCQRLWVGKEEMLLSGTLAASNCDPESFGFLGLNSCHRFSPNEVTVSFPLMSHQDCKNPCKSLVSNVEAGF